MGTYVFLVLIFSIINAVYWIKAETGKGISFVICGLISLALVGGFGFFLYAILTLAAFFIYGSIQIIKDRN